MPSLIFKKGLDLDALLSRTGAAGPWTLLLFPDECYPLGSLFSEPVGRSFKRWNEAAEKLLNPKSTEAERREVLAEVDRGDFWTRHSAVVGAALTESLLRNPGQEAYLKALAAGPRAVASLYVSAAKGTKQPAFGKAVLKALEAPAPAR